MTVNPLFWVLLLGFVCANARRVPRVLQEELGDAGDRERGDAPSDFMFRWALNRYVWEWVKADDGDAYGRYAPSDAKIVDRWLKKNGHRVSRWPRWPKIGEE